MLRSLCMIFAVAVAAPAPAQVDWRRAQRVDVELSNFDFEPSEIRLAAGRPVLLHLVNNGKGGHNFTARAFFAAAQVRPGDHDTQDGSVEVPGGGSRDIALVPARGRYKLKCTHTLHKTFGMKGEIFVD